MWPSTFSFIACIQVLIILSKLSHQQTSETGNSMCYVLKHRVHEIKCLTENSRDLEMIKETESYQKSHAFSELYSFKS